MFFLQTHRGDFMNMRLAMVAGLVLLPGLVLAAGGMQYPDGSPAAGAEGVFWRG